jgi:hypothetical protein
LFEVDTLKAFKTLKPYTLSFKEVLPQEEALNLKP